MRNSNISKLLGLCLIAILVLPLLMGGCSTPVSAAEVNASAIDSYQEVTSLKYDMTMNLEMSLNLGGKTESFIANMDGTSIIDNANKQMQLTFVMEMDIPDQGKQQLTMEEYLIGEWVYMKMGLPGMGETWMKNRITDEMWASQNQADQQIEFLRTASNIELLGSEKVDGVDCFIEKLTPDMGQLLDWAMSQMQSTGSAAPELGQVNPGDWFKNVTIKLWIAKDTRLIMKEDMSLELNITAKDVGIEVDDTEGVTAKINVQLRFYDYNKPASIVLPPAGSNAVEGPLLN